MNNNIYMDENITILDGRIKETHTTVLILGILSIVFSLLIAIAGDVLGIIGIVMSVVNRKNYNVKAGFICSIIGLVISIANHVVAFLLMPRIIEMIIG